MMAQQQEDKSEKAITKGEEIEDEVIKFPWKPVALAFLGVVGLWLLSPLVLKWFFNGDWDAVDKFGGGYGAVGALFSGFALAGVIVAILLQKRELELQREELKQTRIELARTARAQEESEKALAAQALSLSLSAQAASLQYIPIFDFKIHIENNFQSQVFIENIGNMPAYDLDILILPVYRTEVISAVDFVANNFTKDNVPGIDYFTSDCTDEYGLADSLSEFSLPTQFNLSGNLFIPIDKTPLYALYVLFQFRDVQGSNFSQLYHFFPSKADGTYRFNLFNLTPTTPTRMARVVVSSPNDEPHTGEPFSILMNPLETEDSSEIPQYLLEFAEIWKHSVPAVLTTTWLDNLKDRLTLRPTSRRV